MAKLTSGRLSSLPVTSTLNFSLTYSQVTSLALSWLMSPCMAARSVEVRWGSHEQLNCMHASEIKPVLVNLEAKLAINPK